VQIRIEMMMMMMPYKETGDRNHLRREEAEKGVLAKERRVKGR
jgi:hypothetical protein